MVGALGKKTSHYLILTATGLALMAAPLNSKSYATSAGTGHSAKANKGPKGDLPLALKALRSIPSGAALLVRAEKAWFVKGDIQLLRFFELGKTSRTDAVLTRHFNTETGKERREREIMISIRQNQPLEDMVLDMAHELTHATAEPSWDPYDPNLTLGKYISAALEGPGGEVEAVVSECKVGLELYDNVQRCKRYIQHDQKLASRASVDRESVKKDFYRVGKWKSEVISELGSEANLFPYLSSEKPELYSSTGQSPYPVALVQEFTQLNQIACDNVRRRIQAKSQDRPSERSPASHLRATNELLVKRCNSSQFQ